jgi:hypothetical protein
MKKSAWHLRGTEEGLQQIGKLHLAARDSGQTILEIDVCGKRGVGFCESMPGGVHPFERVNTVAIPSQALRLDGRREGAETRRQHLRRERARVNEDTQAAALLPLTANGLISVRRSRTSAEYATSWPMKIVSSGRSNVGIRTQDRQIIHP